MLAFLSLKSQQINYIISIFIADFCIYKPYMRTYQLYFRNFANISDYNRYICHDNCILISKKLLNVSVPFIYALLAFIFQIFGL